ncbi:MAG: phospholipid carrier-dependent glycosyltransferase [Thermoanaerobaculia bacterium]
MSRARVRILPETLLALLAALLVLAEPSRVPLVDPDEGRYAEIPREMLVTGDWILPHENGLVYIEKPPLSYWLVAGSYRLFGVNEAAARFPGKLATVGTMLALFLFARRQAGERAGALAALFFGGSLLGFGLARIVLIDPILTAAQTAAVLSFAALAERDLSRPRERALALGFAVAVAAAVLLKGLVGVLLPGGAVLLWTAATGRTRPLRTLLSPLPVLAFLALAVPWHVAAALREPGFLRFYFVHEHFERFLLPDHRRPGAPWYFLAVVAGGFLPFTPLLPRLRAIWPGRRRAGWAARPLETFLFLWVLLVVAFFSLSKSKLIPYVHPVFPALALLLALAVTRDEEGSVLRAGERWSIAGLLGLLSAAAAWAGASEDLAIPDAAGPFLVLSAALLAGFLLVAIGPTVVPERGIPLAGAAWVLFLGGALIVLPPWARWDGSWPLVAALDESLRPGDLLVQRGDYVESLPFYARRVTPLSRIGAGSELAFGRDRDRSGIFQTDEEFTRLWNGPRRVFVLLHRDVLREWADPETGRRAYRILATAHRDRLVLVSNDAGKLLARSTLGSSPEAPAAR